MSEPNLQEYRRALRLATTAKDRAYIKLMLAKERMRGVRLTADEVFEIAELDDAVFTAAKFIIDDLISRNPKRAK